MLAQTPPMGWNSWNTFGKDINEQVVKDTADAMVNLGFKDVGYEYVVIDDCWSLRERDKDGRLVADPEKFPSGMKALADYVHSKGLKFGMYSCAGTVTCGRYPGSFEHEFVDAQTFASWGVDFLKYDFCYRPERVNGPILYNRMGMALKATGRDILFSACSWGAYETEKWVRSSGAHMYRSTGDINDSFRSFADIAMSQVEKLAYSGPYCYNDIDMLICGMHGKGNVANGGCTDIEYKTHFALWCLFQSPLMIGGDITKLDNFNLELLKNRELIAINQDVESRPPMKIGLADRPVFFKHLTGGDYVIAMFNLSDKWHLIDLELYDVGITAASGYGFEGYEVFTGAKTGFIRERFSSNVGPHDCAVYRVKLRN